MKKSHILAASLITLTACGMDQEDFDAAFPPDVCAFAEECVEGEAEGNGDPLEATCEEAMVATLAAFSGDASCTYEAQQAALCIETIETATCDDEGAGEISTACRAVYSGDSCNLTISDYL